MRIWLACALLLLAGCASYDVPEVSETAEIGSEGCNVLVGRDRLECTRKILTLCQQARNVTAQNQLIGEDRQGRYVTRSFQLCLVGSGGFKFACYRYHQTIYKPSFWDRMADYGIPAVVGAIITALSFAL